MGAVRAVGAVKAVGSIRAVGSELWDLFMVGLSLELYPRNHSGVGFRVWGNLAVGLKYWVLSFYCWICHFCYGI